MSGYQVSESQQYSTHTYYEHKFAALNNEMVQVHKRNAELAARISQLEKHIHYPHSLGQDVAMKEAAVRAEAVPMRSDVETILTLKAFVESISNTGKHRYAVPQAVNDLADEALGRKE